MKKVLLALLLVAFVFSCKNESRTEEKVQESQEIAFASFGDKIDAEGAIAASEMAERFNSLSAGDTLITKVSAKINEVCSCSFPP